LIEYFLEKGTNVEDEVHRAHHLMGLQLPSDVDGETLVAELQARNIYISLRGNNIRISINVFNNETDIRELIATLEK